MLNPEGWFALSWPIRALCWLLSTLCALVLFGWLVIRPVTEAQTRLANQHQQQHAAQREQWRKLRALSIPSDALAIPALVAFSPLDFQSPERQLVRWQPATGGGELVLETGWNEVIETFVLLTERGMQVPAFSLLPVEGALHFTLRVEQDHAD